MPNSNDQTPLLSLPYIQGAQAQKHVTHNEALELLDVVVQLAVESLEAVTPPSSAAEGQAWVVGAAATGAWSGYTGQIAAWRGGGWLFVAPQIGWRAWDKTNAVIVVYDGLSWTSTASSTERVVRLTCKILMGSGSMQALTPPISWLWPLMPRC